MLALMAHTSLRNCVQAIRHVYLVRTFIVALPCLAEQPTSVRGVLETRPFRLLLVDEVDLVVSQVHEVPRTVVSRQTNYAEFLALLQLFRARRSSAVAVYGCVLAVAPLAIIVAGAILFTDTTRNVMHRVVKNYFSPEQSPDETGEAASA